MMKAVGLLFMSRTPLRLDRDIAGQPLLVLRLVCRVAAHQTEAWTLTWTGPEAKAFYDAHAHSLKPGDALTVVASHLRSHANGPLAEVTGRVEACALAPQGSRT